MTHDDYRKALEAASREYQQMQENAIEREAASAEMEPDPPSSRRVRRRTTARRRSAR